MKRTRMPDVAISVLIVVLVVFTFAPVCARLQRSPADAKCQSNLRRWAQAMSEYLSDHNERYPTQRDSSSIVQLALGTDANGYPIRFMFGPNWVEALYPYLWSAASHTGQDWKSFRRCPNSQTRYDPLMGALAVSARDVGVTYAFNCNLMTLQTSVLQNPHSLMMFREMDRRVNSVLRPSNNTTGRPSNPPVSPFLAAVDSNISPSWPIDPNRHGAGSYIAFADGHVRYFTTDYYPTYAVWDTITQRWYNFVYASPTNDTQRMHNKSIAITP